MHSYIRYLEATIQQLELRLHQLEGHLSKNSSNTIKPPGSDGLKMKPKSLRGKSNKKPGAQQGYLGKGLAQFENPDLIVIHAATKSHECSLNLSRLDFNYAEKFQIFDIPKSKIKITGHRVFKKQYPCCRAK